jgi:predicted nucleic acid-binding protein
VVYLDTSALAKWYLNETGSDDFAPRLATADARMADAGAALGLEVIRFGGG